MTHRSFRCFGRKVGLACGGLIAAGNLNLARSATDDVVDLPPFTVTETKSDSRWRYAEIPGLEVLSECSDQDTRVIVEAIYRQRFLTLPPIFRPKLAVPLAVLLFDRKPEPLLGAKPLDAHVSVADDLSHRSNVIERTQPDRQIICLNLWGSGLHSSFAFRIEMQSLLSLHVPAAPDWLQGALCGPFGLYWDEGRFVKGTRWLSVSPAEWFSPTERANAIALGPSLEKETRPSGRPPDHAPPSPLMAILTPLARVFSEDSPPDPTTETGLRWLSTSSLFARWALFVDKGRHRVDFWNFAEEACAHPVTEAMFRDHFGLSFSEAEAALSWYLPAALVERPTMPVAAAKPLELRAATLTEIARVRGDWERGEAVSLAGHFPELAAKYREQAGRTLRSAHQRDPGDLRLTTAMGLAEYDVGHSAQARELLELATTQPVRPLAYLDLAQMQFAAASESTPGGAGPLSETQVKAILAPLSATRRMPPMFEAYNLAAETWSRFEGKPSRDALAVLVEGAQRFPRRLDFTLKVARLQARAGYFAEAASLCRQALSFAPDAPGREPFEHLLETLPPP